MDTIAKHLKKHPHCRPSTLRYLEKRDAKTAQLRSETERARVSAMKPVKRVLHFAGLLARLAGRV